MVYCIKYFEEFIYSKGDIKYMSTNKIDVNKKNYNDEIELRDLIMILWNRKIMIIAITLIFALLAGLFTKLMVAPVYSTSFNVVARIPSTYNTKYGEYTLPITSTSEYINLMKSSDVLNQTAKDLSNDSNQVSAQSISGRISFGTANDGQSIYQVNVTGSTPEEAVSLANALYENYVEYIEVLIKERAINYYYNDFKVKYGQNEAKLQSNVDLLARYEALLESIPQTIDQKAAMEELPNTNDYIVLENIINPNYTHLEHNILEVKQTINILENDNAQYSIYLEELEAEMAKISEYYAGDRDGVFETDIIDNMDIFKLSEPVVPASPSGPSTMRNVVIAGLLGGMIGVFAAFFIAYWKREI